MLLSSKAIEVRGYCDSPFAHWCVRGCGALNAGQPAVKTSIAIICVSRG